MPRDFGRTTPGRMLIEFGWPWPTMMLNGTWTNAIWRSGPVSAGSERTNSALSERFCLPGGTGCGRFVDDAGQDVVVEVPPDARQVHDRLDADGPELVRVADPRQQQELRRFDRAGADDDLARGVGAVVAAALAVLDARRTGRPR